jgi:two-component system OmpR family response regulator
MNRLKVLCVDDDEDIGEMITMSLELDPGMEVRSGSSGATALILAAEWNPDVILLDVMMPTMDGPSTLAHLRENPATENIPVIFMTARARPSDLLEYAAMGVNDVIPKPFDPFDLAVRVRLKVAS